MDKPVAAIEFGSKKLKLVVGYVIDEQVYVIYATTKPYLDNDDNNLNNTAKAVNCVKQIKEFTDSTVKISFKIKDALLCIPPYGLEVYETNQITGVIDANKKIGPMDINNIYNLIRNGASSLNGELVNVIPEVYSLSEDRSFVKPPIGEVSQTIKVFAKVQTLPKHVINNFTGALKLGGIEVKRPFVSPHAASELISTDPNMPQSYLLVDIGSDITSISLIGNKKFFCSRFFEWGGNNITKLIKESFSIEEKEAEKIKILYGLDKKEMNFPVVVCKSMQEDGKEIRHTKDELTSLISQELEMFAKQLKTTISSLLTEYKNNDYSYLPIILIGGGSRLNGLKEFLSEKMSNEDIILYSSKVLGARDQTFINCLGMLLANVKNPDIRNTINTRIGTISREGN